MFEYPRYLTFSQAAIPIPTFSITIKQPGLVIIGTWSLGSGSLCQLNVDLGSFNKILTLPSLNFDESFVIADVPGIIEGASEGTGLGIAFLKHLSRTRLLLHLVDLGEDITGVETAIEIRKLELELDKFSDELSKKERWMVFNKTDLISDVDAK